MVSPALSRRASVNVSAIESAPVRSSAGLDLGNCLFHQLLHGAADLMIGLIDALGVEILAQLAEDILLAGLLEVGGDDFLGIGIDRGAGEAELLGGPLSQELVAPGGRLELQLLVMRELLLKAVLALVERGHGRPLGWFDTLRT